MIWIKPPENTNFANNKLRRRFSAALDKCVTYHDHTYALELKKGLDKDDSSLYNKSDRRFTSAGYKSYWGAIDKTIKFADTLLLKKEESKTKKEARKDNSKPNKGKGFRSFFNDRFHWNRKNCSGRH